MYLRVFPGWKGSDQLLYSWHSNRSRRHGAPNGPQPMEEGIQPGGSSFSGREQDSVAPWSDASPPRTALRRVTVSGALRMTPLWVAAS